MVGSPVLLDGQSTAALAGTWLLAERLSSAPVDVWGQTRAKTLTIAVSGDTISIDSGGSVIGVPGSYTYQGALTYVPSGRDTLIVEDMSLGDIPGFARRIAATARWAGDTLVTETTPFLERLESGPEPGAITRVLGFTVSPDGSMMTVKRTGFRKDPPAMLHGQPYRRADDQVYNVDQVVYVRRDP
jgi:hypothetical protein